MSIEHELQAAALDYVSRGWALTWFDYGQKFPTHPAWNTPGEVVATPEAARRRWNGTPRNIGVVHGLGAVKTCSFDVDQVEHTRAALAEFGIDLEALRPATPCVVGNPANFRLLYRQPPGADLPLVKLEWPTQDGKGKVTIFELRAGPNQDVLPPSLHPSGQHYHWATPLPADPAAMPEPPAALLELWRNWSAWESELKAACPWAKAAEPKAKPHRKGDGARLDIIGAFNAAHDVRELLEANGYRPRGKNRYLPPTSTSGVPSVRVLGSGRVYSSNGSCPLNDGHGHDAFSVFCTLEHRGDVRAAVEAAAELLGIEPDTRRKSEAAPAPDAAADDPRPAIQLVEGERSRILQQAEDALIGAGGVYHNKAGMMVRVTRTGPREVCGIRYGENALTILPATAGWLTTAMDRCARWEKRRLVQAGDAMEYRWSPTDPPGTIARYLLEQVGDWRLPYLTGIVECPTLRPDGTVLEREGYDPATGLFFDAGGVAFDSVADRPSKAQAAAALESLIDVVKDFPFAEPRDRSVFLSGALTVPVRHMLRDSPLHCFSSSRPRAGKSYQADLAALIATGRTAPAMAATNDPAEEEKRIVSILLSGVPLALIDNIDEPLRSARLCSAITQETFRGRLLGLNRTADLATRLVWFASGNNLRLHDDLNPRALLGYLVPDTDRPEEREFDRDLKPWVIAHRHRLASAAITVLRAYIAAGSPGQGLKGFGSAPDWSALVRSALVWLGQDDPVKTQERLRANDPVASNLARLLAAWHHAYDKALMTSAEVAKNAHQHPDLEDVLKDVASKDGDKVNTRALGNYLAQHANRIEAGFKLIASGISHQATLWRVARISDRPCENSPNSHNSPNQERQPPAAGEFGESGEFAHPRSKTCANCKNYSPAPGFDGGTCGYHEEAVENPDARTCDRWETAP